MLVKLLIIGGTRFVGRHLVRAALDFGHEVTLFNRGQSDPGAFPEVEHLRGDRDGGLQALAGRSWDAVVDTCGFVPRLVTAAALALADAVEHYTLISSISVYPDMTQQDLDENAPVAALDDPTTERVDGSTYGGLKALCEQAAAAALPGRVLNVRAGLIVGPYDYTDRFTYWPVRMQLGGQILAPGSPEHPVQFIDARDLAEWIIHMAEARKTGTYNATGPAQPLSLGAVLAACQRVTGSAAALTWVSDDFLLDHGVTPFTDLPLWVPASHSGIHTVSIQKALADGLTFRSLDETLLDTLAWNAARSPASGGSIQLRAGIMLDREAELLSAWRKR
jgi:2'-hydroxyisoflavone reductase